LKVFDWSESGLVGACSSLAQVLHGAQPTATAVCPAGITQAWKFKCWPLQNIRSQEVLVLALAVLGDIQRVSGRWSQGGAGAAGLLQPTLAWGLGCCWTSRLHPAVRLEKIILLRLGEVEGYL